jgi:uncharacterized repeat protein (TIGR01451 family)
VFSAATLLASSTALAGPVLRHQADAQGDVAVFGSTLAFDCGVGVPAPAGATASCAGQSNITDTAPDLYWRDDVANASITATQARTSATLVMPAGAKVTYARLYWSALKEGNQPDKSAVLDWLGGPAETIVADDTWVTSYGFSLHPDWYYYQATGDATDFVATWGAGDFRVSDVEALPLAGINVDRAFSAWTLVVFYENKGNELRNLALFDGFTSIDPSLGTPSASVTLQGFLVPPGYNAKMAAFGYEGDFPVGGDHFTINGSQVGNAVNPPANFFNSSRSFLGVPFSGNADIPQLTGEPGSMGGYDLDTVDITANVSAGDKQAVVGADSSSDIFFLGGFVTSITNKSPDFAIFSKSAVDLNGGALLPGDIIEYTISAKNNGNDTAVDSIITDVLEGTVQFDAGSLEVLEGGSVGNKTDKSGDDSADYNAGSKTVSFRVGTGATSSAGGKVAPGETVTVKFRVKVTAESGQVANQALLVAAGEAGGPEKTWKSDGEPGALGSQPTVLVIDECQSDADCPGSKPHCDTASHTCQPCKGDSDCSNPAAPACQPSGLCGECSASNATQCKPDKPVCNVNSGTCTVCTPDSMGTPGDASKCTGSTDGPKCVTGTDNTNFCGCTTDADCGGPKSGKVCDSADTLKCIDGCRGQGGNGCPDTPAILTCTSKDSSIGKCILDGSPEDTDATCSDGKDNDQDGKIDCEDTSCTQSSAVTACKENTDAKCSDKKDNDQDGTVDCDDTDCQIDTVTVCKSPENTNETCSDKKDNDGNGKTDCEDPSCLAENVTVCTSDENTNAKCQDGKDNDGDGLIDCKDPDCSKNAAVTVCPKENDATTCKDGVDNDGNGQIDCADASCQNNSSVPFCGPENTEDKCKDNLDNDGDGKVDCQDADCQLIFSACPTPENTADKCKDNLDNDGDGKIDCADSDCLAVPGACTDPENTAEKCKDNVDNDGDGKIDCADGECMALTGVCGEPENTAEKCKDKLDNDGDGKVDCTDSDCAATEPCAGAGGAGGSGGGKENTNTLCSDSLDNDDNGLTDCDDPECSDNATVTVCNGNSGLADPGTTEDPAQDGGCGCTVPGQTSGRSPLGAAGIALGLALLSTRRRRQR